MTFHRSLLTCALALTLVGALAGVASAAARQAGENLPDGLTSITADATTTSTSTSTTTPRATVTIKTVAVGSPNNPSIGIVPFTDAVYPNCAAAPAPSSGTPACVTVGGVSYSYGIGMLEITVGQWVAFLNTADPLGKDRGRLYSSSESSTAWPMYGSINRTASAKAGQHYTVAYPEWTNKPFGTINFTRAAEFANSLQNGHVLKQSTSTVTTVSGTPLLVTSYTVRLSPKITSGMYNIQKNPGATRALASGFVVPSQNEWIKAAYYDRTGGGQNSYWKYPTNPGVFGNCPTLATTGCNDTPPAPAVLNPTTGNVTNAGTQPQATYLATTPANCKSGSTGCTTLAAPWWCPGQVPTADCTTNPLGLSATEYPTKFQANLSTVGQNLTRSPWGTLDQGGNVVEMTDTITTPPGGKQGKRVWRREHGGVTNANGYQMWPSAIGKTPGDVVAAAKAYPWIGMRIGVIGTIGTGK